MSKLVPMTQSEYDEYLKHLIPDYAADNVRAGYWDESEALEKSRQQIEALQRYFRTNPQVEKAYYAQIHMPDSGEPPHLILSVDVDGDYRQVATNINEVILGAVGNGQIVDMIQFGKGTLDSYFVQQQPFYKK